jgi:bifunctional DNase/RNase
MTETPRDIDPIEMQVKGLMLDPTSNAPIVVLHDAHEKLLLPIWIGSAEANAIALRLEDVTLPRPMTHDLLHSAFDALEARVERVEIVDLRENTFFARIHLSREEEKRQLDSRPSDAIALALQAGAPIFVARRVLEKADAFALALTELSEEEKIRRELEELDADDPDKYKM